MLSEKTLPEIVIQQRTALCEPISKNKEQIELPSITNIRSSQQADSVKKNVTNQLSIVQTKNNTRLSKTDVRSASNMQINIEVERPKTNKILKKGKNGGIISEKVDDQMNYEHLRELEQIFKDAMSEGADGLSIEQFRVAMKKTMGEHLDDRQLDLMFMKVDNNCDGTVDWDEYLSYMLLEYQEKENMFTLAQDVPFPNPLVAKQCNHIESICRITMLQAFSNRANQYSACDTDDSASRYFTLSKEGVLNVWSLDWQLQKSMILEGSRSNPKSAWFTDLVCMTNCNSIVVASTDYEMSFYSITSNLIQKKFQIKDLPFCALTLDFSFNRADPRKSILVWGDTGGNVYVLRLHDNPNVVLFISPKIQNGKISLDKLVRGNVPSISILAIHEVHGDWVHQLRYFVNKKGQECILSCCVQEASALFFADITETAKSKNCINRKSHFKIRKGVLCISYDPEWNTIITGSRDCDVRVWNPFIVVKSLAVLKGHHTAVLQVLVRKTDHQVISISKDNNIRIWDLRCYTCKQSIHGRNICLGRLDITAAYFNEKHRELVIGTNKIGILHPKNLTSMNSNRKQTRSHQKPVTCVLYNKLFHQIVTGGEDSMVCIWDMNTGTKTMQFCAEKGVEITSMTFDTTWRRLVTGLRNGATMLWNFNNGACLRRLANSDDLEISDIIFSKQRIVTAGWGKQPIVYMDSYVDDHYFALNRKHGDDIMSLDYHKHECTLASSAYDGDIYLWSLETGDVIVAFNMHKSVLPIHIGGKKLRSDNQVNVKSSDTTSRTSPTNHDAMLNSQTMSSRVGSCTSSKASPSHVSINSKTNAEIKSVPNHQEKQYTASGTEISSVDIWLPSTLPWLHKKQDSKKHVRFFDNEDDDESDDEIIEEGLTASDRAVYKLLFLQYRHSSENTAVLLSANAMGWITAWSVHQRGGLLGYFKATKHENEMVITMETDSENKFVITGDSRGYIRVWDIEGYCDGEDVLANKKKIDSEEDREDREQQYVLFQHYMPISSTPNLRTSIRGHVKAVTSVAFIERHNLIATGSVDCSVRLWTLCGRFIGTFGQKQAWSLQLPVQPTELPSNIPEDVRRVASNVTLKTIKGGYHTQWKQVKHAVNFVLNAGKTLAALRPRSEVDSEKRKESIATHLEAVENDYLKKTAAKAKGRRKSVTVWLNDTPHAISVANKPADKVENTYQRLQKDGFKSSVLGKTNYKPKNRHRESKIDKEIKWFNKNALVYNSLPFTQLETPMEPSIPDYLHKTISTTGEQRGTDLFHNINTLIARQRAINTFRRRASSKRQSNAFANKTHNLNENNNAMQEVAVMEDTIAVGKKSQKGKLVNVDYSPHEKSRIKKASHVLPSILT